MGLPTSIAASLVKGVTPRTSTSEGPSVPPLYIDQLIRFNMEGGSDPPARMADLIALRIERLPIEARRTLQAVAVVGDATDHESLRCLLADVRSFDELLATLGVAGLVEEKDGIICTTHPLVRDVTLATIPAAVRRELHAKAPLDAHGDPLPLPLEVLALHAYHAQNSFEALMLLEQVADRSAGRGDQGGCVLALRRGLDLARREIFRGELDDPMRAVLIFSRKLGEALARAGDLTRRRRCPPRGPRPGRPQRQGPGDGAGIPRLRGPRARPLQRGHRLPPRGARAGQAARAQRSGELAGEHAARVDDAVIGRAPEAPRRASRPGARR